MNPRLTIAMQVVVIVLAALTSALIFVGICVEVKKLLPKPAAVQSCEAQAGRVIYAHRRKQARCMVQV